MKIPRFPAAFLAVCIGLVSGACSGQRVAPPVRQPRLVLSDGTPVNVAAHPVECCDESSGCCAVPSVTATSRTYTVESPDGSQTWTSTTSGGADGLRIVTIDIPAPKPLPPPLHRIVHQGGSSQEPPIPDKTNWGQFQPVPAAADPDAGRFSPAPREWIEARQRRREQQILEEPFKVIDIPVEFRSMARGLLVSYLESRSPTRATYLRATRNSKGVLDGIKLYESVGHEFSFGVLTEADRPMASLVIDMVEDATCGTVEYDSVGRPSKINLFRD
jgi:hypothetical protein